MKKYSKTAGAVVLTLALMAANANVASASWYGDAWDFIKSIPGGVTRAAQQLCTAAAQAGQIIDQCSYRNIANQLDNL